MTDISDRSNLKFSSLEDLMDELVSHPDEAYLRNGGTEALVYDSTRKSVCVLKGNFTGPRNQVAWELRKALISQHPLPEKGDNNAPGRFTN